jgi:hypothetical protein
LIRVQLRTATFGLLVAPVGERSGAPPSALWPLAPVWLVVEAAPIARWARGREAREVWDYYRRRGQVTFWR